MASTIDMSGRNETEVLVALHKHARYDNELSYEFDSTPLTYRDAGELLGIDRYIQHVRGKSLMVYFSRKATLDLTTYAQRNGEEAVEKAIQELTPAA